jgi:hypothetical protein
LNKRRNPTELKRESVKDKKTELLTLKSLSNSVNKDFTLVSVQDPVNQEELTVISWKEKSLNSMPRKSNQERNDGFVNIISLQLLFCAI